MGSTGSGRPFKKDCLETALKGISGGGEPCIKRQIIPDCGCKVAEGSFAKFSGEPWTIIIITGLSSPGSKIGVQGHPEIVVAEE